MLKKRVFKKFHQIQGKALVLESFFNKDSALRPATLLKKRLQQKRPFPVNSEKFSRTTFLQNTSRRILLFLIYPTALFCKEVLYICSNLLLIEKSTKTHSFYFANTFYALYCECILYYRSKHKHKKSCFVNARILESFYKKGKKIKKENDKVANQKLVKVGNLGNVILSFLISDFSILPHSQNRKLGFKNLGKKFRRFPRFPSFRPGQT